MIKFIKRFFKRKEVNPFADVIKIKLSHGDCLKDGTPRDWRFNDTCPIAMACKRFFNDVPGVGVKVYEDYIQLTKGRTTVFYDIEDNMGLKSVINPIINKAKKGKKFFINIKLTKR